MSDRVFNVLFLCTGNSARSILAEALLNLSGKGHFKAYSAGSMPKGEVHPAALKSVELMGADPASFRSKSWDEFAAPDAPHMDFIFTVCDNAAGEVCPIWPGKPMTAHWGLPDPADATGSEAEIMAAFGETARQLRNRISVFVELPFDALDRMALKTRLDEIGSGVSA